MKALIVLTTCSGRSQAQKLARHLLKKRLAACVQISAPIQSHYRWKGRIQQDREVHVWIKTKSSLFNALSREIGRIHSYEVPEILSIRSDNGSRTYLQWMDQETLP
jgi:periplasmic divalent cation tolerance protein